MDKAHCEICEKDVPVEAINHTEDVDVCDACARPEI